MPNERKNEKPCRCNCQNFYGEKRQPSRCKLCPSYDIRRRLERPSSNKTVQVASEWDFGIPLDQSESDSSCDNPDPRESNRLPHSPSLMDKKTVTLQTEPSKIYVDKSRGMCGQTSIVIEYPCKKEQKTMEQQTEPICCCPLPEQFKPQVAQAPQVPPKRCPCEDRQNNCSRNNLPPVVESVPSQGSHQKRKTQPLLETPPPELRSNNSSSHSFGTQSNTNKGNTIIVRNALFDEINKLKGTSSYKHNAHQYADREERIRRRQTESKDSRYSPEPFQRSPRPRSKSPSRQAAGADTESVFINDLENITSTTSLNKEVAKLKGLSIGDKLSAVISTCCTSAVSIPEDTANRNINTGSSELKSPSSSQFDQNNTLVFYHISKPKSPFRNLISQSNSFIRHTSPTPQSKISFHKSVSSSKPILSESISSIGQPLAVKQSSRQVRSTIREFPSPTKHLRESESPLKKHSHAHRRGSCNRSRVSLEKSRSRSKSPFRQFTNHLKQTFVKPFRQSQGPSKRPRSPKQSETRFESPSQLSESQLQKSRTHSKSPMRQSESPTKNLPSRSISFDKQCSIQIITEKTSQTKANTLRDNRLRSGASSPLKSSLLNLNYKFSQPDYQESSTQSSKKAPANTLENVHNRSRENSTSRHYHPNTDENSTTREQDGQRSKIKSSHLKQFLENVGHRSKTDSLLKYSHAKTDADSTTKEHDRQRPNIGSSPLKQPEAEASTSHLENVRHRSRADNPLKHTNAKTESDNTTNEHDRQRPNVKSSFLPQPEPEANNSSLENVRHRSRADSALRYSHAKDDADSTTKEHYRQPPDIKSSPLKQPETEVNATPSKYVRHRSRADGPLKYTHAKAESDNTTNEHDRQRPNVKSSFLPQPEPEANNSSLENVRHRSRADSPLRYSHAKADADNTTKEHDRQQPNVRSSPLKQPEAEASTCSLKNVRHRSRADGPLKYCHAKADADNTTNEHNRQRPDVKNSPLKQPEPEVNTGPLKYVRHRSRANSPLKYYHAKAKENSSNSKSEANSSSKYLPPHSNTVADDDDVCSHLRKHSPSRITSSSVENDTSRKRYPSPVSKKLKSHTLESNIIPASQSKKNYCLNHVPPPRPVPKRGYKQVGCQKDIDHSVEDDVRELELSTLKALLNQSLNTVRQTAGHQDSQTQTEFLKSKSREKTMSKNNSITSVRQQAGDSSVNVKTGRTCCGHCKCQQGDSQTEEPVTNEKSKQSLIEEPVINEKTKQSCCRHCKCKQQKSEERTPRIPLEEVEITIMPRSPPEEIPASNEKQACCPHCKCQQRKSKESLPGKSEEDVTRKRQPDPQEADEKESLISVRNFGSESLTKNKSTKSARLSSASAGRESVSSRVSFKSVQSAESVNEGNCKCVQVTPSTLNVPDVPLSKTKGSSASLAGTSKKSKRSSVDLTGTSSKSKRCSVDLTDTSTASGESRKISSQTSTTRFDSVLENQCKDYCEAKCKQKSKPKTVNKPTRKNTRRATSKPACKNKPKAKTPAKPGCEHPAYYPPVLNRTVLQQNANYTKDSLDPAKSPSCILVKNCLEDMCKGNTSLSKLKSKSDTHVNNSKIVSPTDVYTDINSNRRDSETCPCKPELNSNVESSVQECCCNIQPSQYCCLESVMGKPAKQYKEEECDNPSEYGSAGQSAGQMSGQMSGQSSGQYAEQYAEQYADQNAEQIAVQSAAQIAEQNSEHNAEKKINIDLEPDPELTPLGKPNTIETLKKELICTFPTTCPCNPCFKYYSKTGCSCKKKLQCNKQNCCCFSTSQTQSVSSNNNSTPVSSNRNCYCYKRGCCPQKNCMSGDDQTQICCTIDPLEALRKLNTHKIKPTCQEKCIIEEILLGDCNNNNNTDDENECNCACKTSSVGQYSSDSLVTTTESGNCYRCCGGGSGCGGSTNDYSAGDNDCCQRNICCCCCTYPSNQTDEGFWKQQVAINNRSALPCAKQPSDPEKGAEKITGENCVPPCRCCCKTRRRPPLPNFCKATPCCKETSPCCSDTPSLCCIGDEKEESTGSDYCCYCTQNPCNCTIDTITAPGPVCFYCKSTPCCCIGEDCESNNSSRAICRCRGGSNAMSNDCDYAAEKDCSVRVAVRIRPQNPREVIDMCRICTTVTPGEPHVILGQDKAFTFDYVFDINCIQCDIYTTCVERLVEGALRGYNATVLAYGQTGSGKTFTMGTGFDHDLNEIQQGIIPRAVRHIFAGIEEMQQHEYDETGTQINTTQFSVGAQFMELYNEEIFDLLDPYNKGRVGFKIHEDCTGQISVSGATISPVHGPQDALRCLQQGALARTTAATQMNDQSSRSHALFTILIRRQRMLSPDESGCPEGDLETLTSKFHFVDLAGSERLKRTGATGDRAREGISINCGLLALGNCISALGDKSKKATHVPYRDSKLTRLLQDSLGGNSQTLMIACVSPCDRDFMETLNTLKYANRARNIKNKVQLNQDQSSRTIAQLRREIAALQMELLEYKQGKRLIDDEGNSCLSDTFHENSMLLADNKRLQQRLKAMQETINVLTDNNTALKVEKETHGWSTSSDSDRSVTNMVAGYLSEIEKLQAKLIESEEMYQQVKKNASGANSHRAVGKLNNVENPADLINLAKRELEKDRELLMSRSLPGLQDDTNNSNNMVATVTNNESFESDSDTESDDKANEMQADLIDINTDIEIKTKLIEQLELSQQRMQLMRQHYEDKLSLLNSKIVNTQKERDEVLANMGPTPTNQPNEKVKKVKEEYERKINDMQREMKKLQQAQREHLRQQRELQAQEVKLRNLRTELTELKSIKTRLIRKMTEQTNRHKEEETRKAREIAQLRKEQRRQENAVKSLQAQVHAKEQILKRKTEEVTALRRSKRDKLSQKASGRVPSKHRENDITAFNARQARQRWDNLYRAMTRASRNKQAVVQLEKELERLMNERETLCRDLTVVQKRQRASGTKNIDLANEEDTIKSNLNYVQDNIAHVQQAIMEFEEGKDTSSNDTQNLQLLIQNVNSIDEAKFLLEHLTNSAIMFQCDSALTQNRLTEHESLLKEVQQESSIQQQLLQHFLAQNNSIQISDLFASLHLDGGGDGEKLNANNLSGSQKSLNSNGTYDIPCDGGGGGNMSGSYVVQRRSISRSPSPTPTVDLLHDKNAKVRRRTAQPQDLLFGEVSHNGDDAMTRSYTQQDTTQRNFHPLMRVPSAPGSLKQGLNSPSLTKKNIETAMASTQPQSPRLTRRGMPNKGSPGLDDDAIMAPQSPPVYRKMISREENSNGSGGSTDVFSRLGAGTQDPAPGGSIHKVTGKIRVGVPLYCTHTVSGHNNSVLSIKVDDDDILYTAAADRTVKVWDLSREVAQHCLSTHPGPVIAVQNDKATRLLFSASGPYVRVWDLRTSNSKPIKTLTSSGQVLAGNANITGVAPGESPITALCMGNSGNLYVAASDKVRIWDLKNISCVGKLSGGHQAAVMCVTAWEGDGGDSDGSTDFVATGSKDHYVKVFEVPKAGGVVYPLLNLEPPHYDGVQALAVAPDAVGADAELFSGSRDSGIKRWDLKSGELKQSLNNAHKGWVSGMAISGDVLLSSCRGGIVRLWNVRTCESLAELKTDLMINDIVASGQRVYTASSSGEVRIWRFAPQEHFPTSNMTSSSIEKK